ncbi:proton-conducting transporter membrane subunit [Solwaraspora sp. WMMD1047]|uniref:hydrogen gas-evolving membrane-bound hydrogenase subunit E n=1 Tax=Solwaraspora sp. WMMD1047 TaxID=3016102 RepID=UPI0024167058|nr:hydrogen gas-evolving membrane-bound hydrogenase subunit E [Solwaraspora sp. WMMD1047]MDG4832161.1 proton-conducting transporter membrane subunit [Solwaraspora sp. WMMD1047]
MILPVVFVLLGGLAATAPLLARRWGRAAGYPLAAGYLLAVGLLAGQLPGVLAGGVVEVSWRWLPALGVSAGLRLDGLAMVFAMLVLGVGTLIMAYCPRYLHVDRDHASLYLLLTLFTVAMLGLILAADLLLLCVFWELTSLLSFALISHAGPAARQPAIRALLVTVAGGLALLAAVALLAATYGTTELDRILADPARLTDSPMVWPVGALLVVAAFSKSAQLPFHFWLPNAMVAITPVSAYLHAATMVKAGIYLLMRCTPLFAEESGWRLTLAAVGLATALFGAFLALRQDDLKALLAYSTVSQLGLLVSVIGIGTPLALEAALLHTIAHALFKATLFMLVGIIDREAGSRDLRQLSGLARVMPVTTVLTGLAAMSMAGLPPLIGFVSKEVIFEALGEANHWWAPVAATLAVTASVLTFAYGTRIMYAFSGPIRQDNLYEPALPFLAPAGVAALLGLVLGPGVWVLSTLIERATLDARPGGRPVELALWHGFTPALWLSLTTIALGTVLFLARRTVNPIVKAAPTSTPVERAFDRAHAGLLRFGTLVGRPDRRSGPQPYLLRPVLALIVLGAVAVATLGRLTPWPGGTSRPGDWPLVGLLALAVGALMFARSALAAVALAGLVGLIMSVWFVTAGAPDVALTLLLVEVLTAVLAMLVLRGLPARLPTTPRRRGVVLAATVGVAAGLAAAYLTAALTGRAGLSEPGRYFLTNAAAQVGGENVVNTILVDFRALDTLGEAVVLASVALGLGTLLRPAPDGTRGRAAAAPGGAPGHDTADPGGAVERPGKAAVDIVLWFAYRALTPVMLAVSGFLFLRGHDEPGGGFIAALVAGTALGLGQLAFPGSRAPLLGRVRARPLLATGLLLAVLTGLGATVRAEPFLSPVSLRWPGSAGPSVSGALLFDLGVYLLVLGLIAASTHQLGTPPGRHGPAPDPMPATPGPTVPAGPGAAGR